MRRPGERSLANRDIYSVKELHYIDDAKVVTPCKVVQRHWRLMWKAASSTDPSASISTMAKVNMKLVVSTSNTRVYSSCRFKCCISLVAVCMLIGQCDIEVGNVNLIFQPKVHSNDWPKAMEAVEENLKQFHGINRVTLNMCCERNRFPPMTATDPRSNYPTVNEELLMPQY